MSMGDHGAALVALLYLPVVVTGLLLALEAGGRAHVPAADSLRRALVESPRTVRMAVLGMAISATVHLALAPSHWDEDRVRAALFALDGAALIVVAAASLVRPVWRAAAVALSGVGIVAYAGYVAAGAEPLDSVGLATKAVEVAVIFLVLAGTARQVRFPADRLRELTSPRANGGLR